MKRTITKQTLNELALVMPVISEYELGNMLGATKYYDYSGNYLGEIGTETDIKVTNSSSDTIETISRAQSPTMKASLDKECGSMYNLSSAARGNVIRSIADDVGVEGVLTEVMPSSSTMGIWRPKDQPDKIRINENASRWNNENANVYDIICCLIHENAHRNYTQKPKDGVYTEKVKAQMEIDAISKEKASPYYNQASQDYKDNADDNYDRYIGTANGD